MKYFQEKQVSNFLVQKCDHENDLGPRFEFIKAGLQNRESQFFTLETAFSQQATAPDQPELPLCVVQNEPAGW